ncbi:MAG: class I SAM-dependent methyltransferase [Thermoleophilia bacterium]|nr:class I SAM-dependent methyltransferase [Thermoleophilia bacterium]
MRRSSRGACATWRDPRREQAGCTIAEIWDPVPDARAGAALGRALRALRYNEESIVNLLGEDGPAAGLSDVAVFDRRLPDSPLGDAARLLLLQIAITRDDAVAALGDEGLDALLTTQIARADGDRIVPRGRVVPAEGLLMSFDGFAVGDDDPHGYVASYTPTASWLAALTPRRRFGRALDIGTGSGAQALLASRHSRHVVATDLNPRAVAFTSLNAALNGIDNVEVRLGSLFEPVAGETFDLITCNAPYVVSPEDRWQYRDASGFEADQLSQTVVTQAPRYLNDGGFACMLVSWLAESEESQDVRVERWLADNDCDSWVIGLSGADPLDHAAGWNEHLSDDPEDYGAALDRWTAYFEELGVGWITEGAVLMHRRSGDVHMIRTDSADEDELEYASDQVERVFEALALVAELDDPQELLGERLALAEDARIEQSVGEDGARVVLEAGTWPELEVDDETVDVLVELDGRATVGEAIDRARMPPRRSTLEDLQELLELGMLELRS